MKAVLYFRPNLAHLTVEDSSKIEVLPGALQRTDHFPSIFSDESVVQIPLDVCVHLKSQSALKSNINIK